MTDKVSVCTRVAFGESIKSFDLPDTLLIDPALILDETEGVYRLSIGATKPFDDEYTQLFAALDKHMPFVENMHIIVDDKKLTFKFAYIMRYDKQYAVFYEIEAIEKDLEFCKI